MGREEDFDSFYNGNRRPLLLQTFALTGDATAAQTAVREAFVRAWQHWRKVARLEDPSDWVRPRAWRLAQRRHTGRIWRRNRGLDEEHQAVLDALGGLSPAQRRALLLVQLAGTSLPRAARELGVRDELLARHLQAATAGLATALDTDSSQVRRPVRALEEALHEVRLPRAPIVRRAGRRRRRRHAAVATVLAVGVALGAGVLVKEPGRVPGAELNLPRPQPATVAETMAGPDAKQLLDRDQIRRLGLAEHWTVQRTFNNTAGNGLNTICQRSRFADPDGLSAIVRTFRGLGRPARSAVQTVEVSRSVANARKGFATAVGWYAGCQVARLQVLDAYRVTNIGDQADVLMLRVWSRPVTTYSVALARIGTVTTTTVGRTRGGRPPPAKQITQSLADAVAMLCSRSRSDGCRITPTYRRVPPPPSGEEPGILAVADLPPVGDLDEPWVGTRASTAVPNPSATACDRADFVAAGATRTRTRTYLIPQAVLPARFGLSETYGVFPSPDSAARFLGAVRQRVAGCAHRDLATKVFGAHSSAAGRVDWSTWRLSTAVSPHEKVRFRLGFVRVGDRVAELTFASTPHEDITSPRFRALVHRAGERLREL